MKNLKRGFTLAEAMVSMALIVVATVLAVTISVMCTSQMNKSYKIFQSSNLAADMVTCYQLAYGDTDFCASQHGSFTGYLSFYLNYGTITSDVASEVNPDYTAGGSDLNDMYTAYAVTYTFSVDTLDAEVKIDYLSGKLYLYTYYSDSKSGGTNTVYTFGYNIKTNSSFEV